MRDFIEEAKCKNCIHYNKDCTTLGKINPEAHCKNFEGMNMSINEEVIVEIPDNSIKFEYKTAHLLGFEQLDNATKLYGGGYRPIKKAIWYLINSRVASRKTDKPIIIKLGDIETDLRISGLFPLGSGLGKKELKYVVKNCLLNMGFSVEEPTSLHPEQLVGKVAEREFSEEYKDNSGKIKKRRVRKWVKLHGYLSRDFIQVDEGVDFLTQKEANYEESRKYTTIALDPYGKNTISKKSVDNSFVEEERLEYMPDCNMQIFFQPTQLSADLIRKGFVRRFLAPYVQSIKLADKRDYYSKKIYGDGNKERNLKEFIQLLKENYSKRLNQDFVFEDLPLLEKYHRALVDYCDYKCPNYTQIIDFTLQEWLIKFACILASSRGSSTITHEFWELAFTDLLELFDLTLDFINTKFYGSFDYGEGWKGAIDKDREILAWLYQNGAVSYDETFIPIRELQNKIMEIFRIDNRQAIRKTVEYKERGWIDTKKGQHDSKAWLAFEPISNEVKYKSIEKCQSCHSLYKEILEKIANNEYKTVITDSSDVIKIKDKDENVNADSSETKRSEASEHEERGNLIESQETIKESNGISCEKSLT
jgi:hypothetical protein